MVNVANFIWSGFFCLCIAIILGRGDMGDLVLAQSPTPTPIVVPTIEIPVIEVPEIIVPVVPVPIIQLPSSDWAAANVKFAFGMTGETVYPLVIPPIGSWGGVSINIIVREFEASVRFWVFDFLSILLVFIIGGLMQWLLNF